jgi:hypothetical protein
MTWLPFIDGLMQLQFFVELAGLTLVLSGLSLVLSRAGMPVNKFWKAVGLFLSIFLYLKYRVYPPMPFSVLATYVVVTLAAILLWVSSSEEDWQDFRRPIIATLDAETQTTKIIRAGLLALLPVLAWYLTWDSMLIKINEPVELRTVGPAPPRSFKLHGKEIILETAQNPYRINRDGVYDPHYMTKKIIDEKTGWSYDIGVVTDAWQSAGDTYLEAAKEGGKIYFQECVFCHGANLNGRGIFSHAFSKPFPVNFTDPGTIAQRQESYEFWRTASGGMNLPNEGFPWISTMPRMEEHLSIDDIWKVVLFTYWHTGWAPRTWD